MGVVGMLEKDVRYMLYDTASGWAIQLYALPLNCG